MTAVVNDKYKKELKNEQHGRKDTPVAASRTRKILVCTEQQRKWNISPVFVVAVGLWSYRISK